LLFKTVKTKQRVDIDKSDVEVNDDDDDVGSDDDTSDEENENVKTSKKVRTYVFF
jgi:hypothetical protein